MRTIFERKHNFIVFLFLLFFIITLPLKNSLNSFSIILLSAYCLFLLFKKRTINLQFLKKASPFLLYFFVAGVSVLYSEDHSSGLKNLIGLLTFLLFPFIFSIININQNILIKIIKGFVIWITSLAIYSHVIVLTKLFKNNDTLYNLFNRNYSYSSLANDTIDVHSTYYAFFILTAILFLLFLLFKEKKKLYRVIYLLLIMYHCFFILHLSVRTAILTLFILISFSIFYYFKEKNKVKKGVLFLLGFYILSSVVIYNVRVTRYRIQQVFGFSYSDGTRHDDGNDKINQWGASIKANKNIPFGNGIGDANNSIFESYRELGLDKNAEREYNAHNQFIQTYVGLGLIGFLILLFLFFFYFKYFMKHKSFVGYSFVIISFLLFQTESFLERHHGLVLFTFFVLFFLNNTISESELNGKTNTINNHKKLY